MNKLLQADVHPDAESLNAFVERALQQPERAQIVAHLGSCARCREVVFLAQAAAEADAAPPAEIKTESHPAKSGWPWWRAKWRIAVIPAAALATALGLVIWVQKNSAPPAATVAQVSHPSPMPSSAEPPVARPAQTASSSAVPPVGMEHVQPKASRAGRSNSPSGTSIMNRTAPSQTAESPPPVAQPKAPERFAADNDLASMERQAASQEAMIAPPAPTASPNAQSNGNFTGQAKMAERAHMTSAQAIAAQSPQTPVPPNVAVVPGNLMAPASGGPRLASAAATPSQVELMPQPVNGLAALRLTSHPRLPSGLNAVSSAAMLDRILAVDREGAVFLSRDATKHWERVPVQWTGKAVVVQAPPRELYPLNAAVQQDATLHTSPVASVSMMPAPPAPASDAPPPAAQSQAEPPASNAAPGPPPPAAEANAALAMPGMLFKLINNHHQTWVSADGKVWHEQ